MNKYKNLILNTLIFGLGTFSSKVLVFLLMPLYTRVLTSADYGTVDLIMQTGNLLVPLVMMGISNAVIRFGLDKSINKNDVFTTALLSVGGGFAALLVFYPLIMRIPGLGEYALLIYAFVLMELPAFDLLELCARQAICAPVCV